MPENPQPLPDPSPSPTTSVPAASPPATRPAAAVAPVDGFFVAVAQRWTSLNTTTSSGKVALMEALEGDAEKLDRYIGSVVSVTDVVLHTREVIDEGEIRLALRAVLILDTGDVVGTWSHGALRCLQSLMSVEMWGRPPWRPALKLRVVQQALADGKRTYKLLPESEIVDSPEKPRGKRG